jgi:hypothetical protein
MSIYVRLSCVFRLSCVLGGPLSRLSILYVLCAAGVILAAPALRIVVVEGDGAINNVRTHTTHDPVVEVRDDKDGLVPGASVTFQAPSNGASAEFGDGMRSFVTQTDGEGRAAAHGLRPNSITGPYEIRVTASFNSQTASAVITETNAAPEAKSSKKFWLIGLAVGAAAGGAFAASHGGKSSTSTSTSTPTTGAVVPGSPSFGPPH